MGEMLAKEIIRSMLEHLLTREGRHSPPPGRRRCRKEGSFFQWIGLFASIALVCFVAYLSHTGKMSKEYALTSICIVAIGYAVYFFFLKYEKTVCRVESSERVIVPEPYPP